MDRLRVLWESFREGFLTPARVVPVVMSVLGSAVAVGVAWLAKHGLNLDSTQVLAVLGPLVLGIVGQALHWQKGYREYSRLSGPRAGGAPIVGVGGTEDLDDPTLTDIHPDDAIPDEDDLTSEGAKAEEAGRLKDRR